MGTGIFKLSGNQPFIPGEKTIGLFSNEDDAEQAFKFIEKNSSSFNFYISSLKIESVGIARGLPNDNFENWMKNLHYYQVGK